MINSTYPPRPPRRLAVLGLTLAAHVALLWAWQAAMRVTPVPDGKRSAIDWIDIKLAPPRQLAPPKQAAPPSAPRPVSRLRARAAPAAPAAEPVKEAVTAVPETPVDAASPPSAAAMLEQARRDIGKFDKDLRKEFARKGISKPIDSPQLRLARGIEAAHDAVPPKWYQAAKIQEIIDPGSYGRKRYRVTTAFGTYCVTYQSDNSPTAQLNVGKRVEPMKTNCPENEGPATKQDW